MCGSNPTTGDITVNNPVQCKSDPVSEWKPSSVHQRPNLDAGLAAVGCRSGSLTGRALNSAGAGSGRGTKGIWPWATGGYASLRSQVAIKR